MEIKLAVSIHSHWKYVNVILHCLCPFVYTFMQLVRINQDHAKVVLSQHQKYHKAQQLALEMATVVSEVGMNEFKSRLTQMKLLIDKWKSGESVTFVPSCNDLCKSIVYRIQCFGGFIVNLFILAGSVVKRCDQMVQTDEVHVNTDKLESSTGILKSLDSSESAAGQFSSA